MNKQFIEKSIEYKVQNLKPEQKVAVLDYVSSFRRPIHSTKRYKRRALKQIRLALSNPI